MTLAATPDAGSALDGWSGADCDGNGPCTLTMNRDILCVAVFNPDGDADGISDKIEDAGPNNGDGNNDGTPDSLQENVTSFPGVNARYMTLVSPEETELSGVYGTGLPACTDLPADRDFPMGAVGFRIRGVDIGGTVGASLILHDSYASINAYYKYGPTPDDASGHWYEFNLSGGTGADIATEDGKTVIHLSFLDGGRGDDDLRADGVITDPGAPAVAPEPPEPPAGGSGSSASSYSPNFLLTLQKDPFYFLDYIICSAILLSSNHDVNLARRL